MPLRARESAGRSISRGGQASLRPVRVRRERGISRATRTGGRARPRRRRCRSALRDADRQAPAVFGGQQRRDERPQQTHRSKCGLSRTRRRHRLTVRPGRGAPLTLPVAAGDDAAVDAARYATTTARGFLGGRAGQGFRIDLARLRPRLLLTRTHQATY
ncbi:hypothetical protein M885DRAFT_531160 [Pelagophyceae sp. CCMP2097]|nr:hypothetical protein M885DRAFT_531160 [Pelagophyceae sp. CCMP2097]